MIPGYNLDYHTQIEFSMNEVAKCMGEEFNFDKVYSELRRLKHTYQIKNEQEQNEATRLNTISVDFSHRIFHVQSSGDCSPEKWHKHLQETVQKREEGEVMKTHLLHAILWSALSQNSHPDTAMVNADESFVNPLPLRKLIDRYFSSEGLDVAYLKEHNIDIVPPVPGMTRKQEEEVKKEIEALLTLSKQSKLKFTGTTIARIFYGIESPLFPSKTWQKQKRFWWKHVRKDFDKIRKIATSKLQ